MANPNASENTNGGEARRHQSRLPWRLIVGLVTIAALAYVGRDHLGELKRLRDVDPWHLAALVVLFVLARLVGAEVLVQTLGAIGHRLGRFEVLMLNFLRTYASLIVPRAGFGAAGVYLKAKHGVRYSDYAALLMPIALIHCCTIGIVGLVCLAILSLHGGQTIPRVIAGAFLLSVLGGAATLLVRFAVPESWDGRLARFARRLSLAWRQLSTSRTLLLRLLVLHVLGLLLRALRLQVAFWSVGVSVNFLGVLVASLLADLMFLISFTPNGLGFQETAIVFASRVAGATPAEGLAAAILDRLVTSATVIVAAQIALWRMPRGRSTNVEMEKSVQET